MDVRTDRQTDMTKLIVDFRSFAKAPKSKHTEWPMALSWMLTVQRSRSETTIPLASDNWSGNIAARATQSAHNGIGTRWRKLLKMLRLWCIWSVFASVKLTEVEVGKNVPWVFSFEHLAVRLKYRELESIEMWKYLVLILFKVFDGRNFQNLKELC
jgi:hypothetical protein